MSMLRVWSTGLLAIWLAAEAPAAPQQPAASDVETILAQAREEIRSFEKAGGRKDDPNHPVGKWVLKLWALYEQAPRSPETAKAASEAVHLLIHADRFQEAYQRADRVPADDPAWEGLSGILVEAASLQKDPTYFLRKLPSVLPRSANATVRAAIQWNLGRVWLAQKQEDKAKAAFQASVESAADSPPGRQAERQLYELLRLGPGQPAPAFSATATDGSRISLAGYRGKPVVIVFWSST
jgi:tetratricopeptide (TPR) repeat protein